MVSEKRLSGILKKASKREITTSNKEVIASRSLQADTKEEVQQLGTVTCSSEADPDDGIPNYRPVEREKQTFAFPPDVDGLPSLRLSTRAKVTRWLARVDSSPQHGHNCKTLPLI